METNGKRTGVAFIMIAASVIGTWLVFATTAEEVVKVEEKILPAISVQTLEVEKYAVSLTGFGEVNPLESTQLAAQVSGAVTHWSPEFVDGGYVRKGEVLFTIDDTAYEAAVMQAEANMLAAEARLIEERARAEVAKTEAKLLTKEKVTDLYLRKPQVMSAEAALKSAQSALKLANRDLNNCKVKAPFDAVIAQRQLGLGQMLMAGSPVATLHNIEKAQIVFPVANFDRSFLPTTLSGMNAKLSYAAKADHIVDATLVRDIGVVDNNTRMLNLVAEVSDPYGLNSQQQPLYFGTYVTVSYQGITLDNVYKLPQEMVQNNRVWTVEYDKLYARDVKVLREEGAFFIIQADLTEGTQLAVSVPDYPQNGMSVQIVDTFNTAQVSIGE